MIQIFNNILNALFKVIRFATLVIVIAFWLCTYLITYLLFKLSSRRRRSGFNHPNFILLSWIMAINRFYKQFIF